MSTEKLCLLCKERPAIALSSGTICTHCLDRIRRWPTNVASVRVAENTEVTNDPTIYDEEDVWESGR